MDILQKWQCFPGHHDVALRTKEWSNLKMYDKTQSVSRENGSEQIFFVLNT